MCKTRVFVCWAITTDSRSGSNKTGFSFMRLCAIEHCGSRSPQPPPLHQIRRYPAPYISKAGQKATPSNILQPFIPHCFPLQSPYINSRPFISSPHYFYSSPIRFRICPTPAQPTSILTRIVFPADQQPILNDQFYVEDMPEEIVIVVKLIYSDRTHST